MAKKTAVQPVQSSCLYAASYNRADSYSFSTVLLHGCMHTAASHARVLAHIKVIIVHCLVRTCMNNTSVTEHVITCADAVLNDAGPMKVEIAYTRIFASP